MDKLLGNVTYKMYDFNKDVLDCPSAKEEDLLTRLTKLDILRVRLTKLDILRDEKSKHFEDFICSFSQKQIILQCVQKFPRQVIYTFSQL